MSISVHTFLHSADAFNNDIIHTNLKCHFFGSCNGLICLVYEDSRICVWNLATKLSSRLSPRVSYGYSHRYITYGFGYVASTNTYKVVAMYKRGNLKLSAKVYNLGDARWTNTQCMPDSEPYRIHFNEQNGVYHNGRLYWIVNLLTNSLEHEKDYLLFIDLATMGRSYLNLPNLRDREDLVCRQMSNHRLSSDNAILRVLKDSLCVWYPINYHAHIAIWRLEDEVSWIPLLTVNLVDLQVLPPSCWFQFLDGLFMA